MTAVLERPLTGETNQVASFEAFVHGQPETHGVYVPGQSIEEDGVYISPATVAAETPVEELPQVQNVEILPGARLSAADSQNGVIFGELDFVVQEQPSSAKVAIKPFKPNEEDPDKAQRALCEHDCLQKAAELGFDTLRPLALMKDNETTYLITELRRDIQTLDNVDWTISPSDERYATEVLPHLTFIAEHMGERHGKGLFDDDPQPKNFAKGDTGQAIVIDLESASVASNASEHADWLSGGYEVRDSKAYQGVKQFWFAHTRGIGVEHNNIFLAGEDYDTYMRVFGGDFLTPYMQSLQKHLPAEVAAQVDIEALRNDIYEHTARMG